MNYEDLEDRISQLEIEVKEKLTWSELMWTGVALLIGYKIGDYLDFWVVALIFGVGAFIYYKFL